MDGSVHRYAPVHAPACFSISSWSSQCAWTCVGRAVSGSTGTKEIHKLETSSRKPQVKSLPGIWGIAGEFSLSISCTKELWIHGGHMEPGRHSARLRTVRPKPLPLRSRSSFCGFLPCPCGGVASSMSFPWRPTYAHRRCPRVNTC